MSGKEMFKYEPLMPALNLVGFLLPSVPFVSAIPTRVVAGCASMTFMMMREIAGHSKRAPSE